MRHAVRDYVAASIDHAKPQLERYIADHLQCLEPFPFVFCEPATSIREIHRVKVTPRFRADYPPLDITVTMRVAVTTKMRDRKGGIGIRTLAIDVELDALATVQGSGYDVEPQRARLVAWWGDF
jgi:hypothetical protein